MNKQDRKLIIAVNLFSIGVLIATISLSGYFWSKSTEECKKIAALAELRDWVNGENNKFDSKHKIESIKKQFDSKGIGVEE